MPGHWKSDFIKGACNQSSVGVLVDRSSRLVLWARKGGATAASAVLGFAAKLNLIAGSLSLSLTYDQGKAMAKHAELTAQTGVNVYFCVHHSPWQRGSCENTSGLLRQYLPTGRICRFSPWKTSMSLRISSSNGPVRSRRFIPHWKFLGDCSKPSLNP
jgi:IS30 family transposase